MNTKESNDGKRAAETGSPRPAKFDTYEGSQNWQRGWNEGNKK